MKELDWIILTSWSQPPRTPQLQQAGLHCSLLPLYMRVCERMVSPSHLHVDTTYPTWMLIIFLIGFLDLVTSTWDGKAVSPLLLQCCYAVFFCVCALPVCVYTFSLFSIHSLLDSKDSGMEAVWPLTSSYPLVLHFHHYPSSGLTPFTHLSSYLVLLCPS